MEAVWRQWVWAGEETECVCVCTVCVRVGANGVRSAPAVTSSSADPTVTQNKKVRRGLRCTE